MSRSRFFGSRSRQRRTSDASAGGVPAGSADHSGSFISTAASVVELVATVLQLRHQFVHATINLEEPDPELDLDFVPAARAQRTG